MSKLFFKTAASKILRSTGLEKLFGSRLSYRILMYHRVLSPEDWPQEMEPGMYVRPETFRMQMSHLKKNAAVLPLGEIIERSLAGTLPERAVAITFDDGWHDNLTNALPILEQYALPATIFLATDYINSNKLFWTDELAHLFSNKQPLELADGSQLGSYNSLAEAVLRVKKSPLEDKIKTIGSIRNAYKESTARKPQRTFLSWSEVREMAEGKKADIQFGCHTHLHKPLTILSDDEIEAEVTTSLQAFRAEGIPALDIFCYPEGLHSDQTQRKLSKLGITSALIGKRKTTTVTEPNLFTRVGIHQDISKTESLFSARIWADRLF